MLCYLQSLRHRTRQLVVLIVEEVGPTTPKLGALLGIESAIPARNMAIMRSIVEVPKKVSLVGEVEHVGKKQEARTSTSQAPADR